MQYHEPVLVEETLEALQVSAGKKYIDCTLGDGGHSLEILKRGGIVLGLDVEEGSLKRATQRINEAGFEMNFKTALGNFSDIENLAKQNGFEQVNGVLFDLGYSSSQLEDLEVGLSFLKDQPLDMRLDKSLGVTAADLVNALPEKELKNLIRNFGEERLAKRFAESIVKARNLKKIESTTDLVQIIVASASPGYEKGRLHPATRTFQALRIAVNSELESLKKSLPVAARALLPGGRMVVISFHSLEDRIVKQFGSSVQPLKKINDKPIGPSEDEIKANPRARSAKMRIFEKL